MSVTLPHGAKELMLHALGLGIGSKLAYRNGYIAPTESTGASKVTWDWLVTNGLAVVAPYGESTVNYSVTLAGCRALGSRLCERITLDLIPAEESK